MVDLRKSKQNQGMQMLESVGFFWFWCSFLVEWGVGKECGQTWHESDEEFDTMDTYTNSEIENQCEREINQNMQEIFEAAYMLCYFFCYGALSRRGKYTVKLDASCMKNLINMGKYRFRNRRSVAMWSKSGKEKMPLKSLGFFCHGALSRRRRGRQKRFNLIY